MQYLMLKKIQNFSYKILMRFNYRSATICGCTGKGTPCCGRSLRMRLRQRAAAAARGFAVQTRRAAVLEVSGGRLWINLLDGAECWSNLKLEDRCMQNFGKTATESQVNTLDLTADDYTEAGAYLCGLDVVSR